jgi:hypothetical protein
MASLGAADATTASDNVGSLVSFFVRNNSVEPNQIQVDELRIDNTWGAVTAPEPHSLAILLIPACLLARRQRTLPVSQRRQSRFSNR